MDVAARADLKSDVMRDLDKQKHALQQLPRQSRPSPRRALDQAIGQLERNFNTLNTMPGQGRPVADRERVAHEHPQPRQHSRRHLRVRPAGLLRLAAPQRRRRAAPTSSAGPPRWRRWPKSIHLLLKLLRDAGRAQKVMATGGQFQQTLPQGRTFQLLRLRIDPALGLVPEISGNRLMVSVRLMRHEADDRLHASSDDTRLRAHALRLSRMASWIARGAKPRIVRCPACGGDSIYAPRNPLSPVLQRSAARPGPGRLGQRELPRAGRSAARRRALRRPKLQ